MSIPEARASFTILQHNTRGWTENTRYALYNTYREYNPDIILLNDIGKNWVKLMGYISYGVNVDQENSAGVALAIKNTIKHEKIEIPFGSDMVAVRVLTTNGPIIIATAYIPPRRTVHFPDFHKLFNRREPVYFLGDCNAQHQHFGYSRSDLRGQQIFQLIERKNIQYLGPPFSTRMDHRSVTSPDIVLASRTAHLNTMFTQGKPTPSDHIPIILKISVNPLQIKIKPRRQFAKADWEQFTAQLENIPIITEEPLTPHELDQATETWTKQVKQAMEDNVPLIKYRTVPGVKPTEEILETRRILAFLQNITTQICPTPELNRDINNYRKILAGQYEQLQHQTWGEIIEKIQESNDPRDFFTSVKRFAGFSKRKRLQIKDNNGNIIHNPEQKIKHFQDHWQQVFRNDQEDHLFDAGNIDRVENEVADRNFELTPTARSDIANMNPSFPTVNTEEVRDIIKRLKPKAPGPTGINAATLKHLPHKAIQNLTTIYNHALSMGYIPKIFKIAKMIFIPKGNKPGAEVSDHRPISLMEVHGKVLDKILNRRLQTSINDKGLNHPDQHGFRPKRGCHTALATINEEIARAINNNHRFAVVMRDVQKAFDKTWINGLKYKILRAQFSQQLIRALSSYLTDRQAYIAIDGEEGPSFGLMSGVPQGGCLSATLYSFFIHDIPEHIPNGNARVTNVTYCDDISQVVSRPGRSLHQLYQDVERAVVHVNDYEKLWKIKTNPNKFQICASSTRHKNKTFKYTTIQGKKIPCTSTGKCLGLTFSAGHGFTTHVTQRVANARSRLNKIKRFTKLSMGKKRLLYLSLVRSAMIYPTVPLNTISSYQMQKMQTIQNMAVKFINPYSDVIQRAETLHINAKIDPLNVVIHRQAAKTWMTIQNEDPELYHKLSDNFPASHKARPAFKSSRIIAEANEPEPRYVQTDPVSNSDS